MRLLFAPLLLALWAIPAAADSRLEELLDQVADRTRDPEAARFRAVSLIKRAITVRAEGRSPITADMLVLCGEVNRKNAFGGYEGYIKFAAAFSEYMEGESLILFADASSEDVGDFCATRVGDQVLTSRFQRNSPKP